MKVSLSWLKEFLDLTDTPEEISEALTLAGLEAEGIEPLGDDFILEIGLTPNLGHCMSIIGMVRELSAILEIPIRRQTVQLKESSEKIEDAIQVTIEDTLQCTKYCARLLRNIKVGPSPDWIREKLEKSGLRSVNNVVDVGNLVMLEMGQPLHIFDYDQLKGKQIIVRAAKEDGKMITLDEMDRIIPDGTLLICDAERPVAFAGVMGEQTSAVTESTQNILIEAAHFTPQAIRKTSKQLNLRTDSSQRFERGIDPLALETALDLAASLLEGNSANGIALAIAHDYEPQIVEMNPKRANRLLGTSLSPSEMSELLNRLEIVILSESDEVIRTQVPSYRNDLETEVDLIEEVGRMYGFNNIPRKISRHASSPLPDAPLFTFEEKVRCKLVAQGLQECLTCDLISPKQVALTAEKEPIHVMHPASVDQSVLRPSLLPSLLEVIKHNLDRQNSQVAAFEVGHAHLRTDEGFTVEPIAAIILTGNHMPHHFESKGQEVDFLQLKGHVENLLMALSLGPARFIPSHIHSLHPGRQAHVILDAITIGTLGEVLPRHLTTLGISGRVYFAEINLHPLMTMEKRGQKTKSFSVMPSSERDWTVSLDDKAPIGPLLEEMRRFDCPVLEEVVLLDLYKSDKIGKNRKNATFRFRYRDLNKTIEAEEIEIEHKRLTQHMAEKLGNRVP